MGACHECTSELTDGARFCAQCGAPTQSEIPTSPGMPAVTAVLVASPDHAPRPANDPPTTPYHFGSQAQGWPQPPAPPSAPAPPGPGPQGWPPPGPPPPPQAPPSGPTLPGWNQANPPAPAFAAAPAPGYPAAPPYDPTPNEAPPTGPWPATPPGAPNHWAAPVPTVPAYPPATSTAPHTGAPPGYGHGYGYGPPVGDWPPAGPAPAWPTGPGPGPDSGLDPSGQSSPARPRRLARWTVFVAAPIVLVVGIAAVWYFAVRDDGADADTAVGGELVWAADLTGDAYDPIESVLAVEGLVLAAVDQVVDGRPAEVFALDVEQGGEPRWTHEVAGTSAFLVGGSNGTVVVLSSETLTGLDAETGAVNWSHPAAGAAEAVVESTLVLAVDGATVRARAVDSGAEVWSHESPSGASNVFLDGAGDGMVIVSDADGAVAALELATGDERWSATFPGRTVVANLDDGRVFLEIADGISEERAVRIDAQSGDELWDVDLPAPAVFVDADDAIAVYQVLGESGEAPESIAFEVDTGFERWSEPIPGQVDAVAVAIVGDVVVVDAPGRIFGLDTETGERLWRESVGGEVPVYLGVFDGTVYAASSADAAFRIVGIQAETGAQVLGFTSSAALNDADSIAGRLFIASADGAVYALG